jgi:DNA helicase-2/ATP-dependent DNA helicase PcrA
MPQVSNEDIAYAERILFGKIGVFDDERIRFIKEGVTCDLQAVPGSGKTTVLLAKLLILERYLPLSDGRGILVISHTNAAVDEIRKEIGVYCPKLFSAPNFVGTIQSYIDRFLAIPYYTHLYKKKPVRIDDEIYVEKSADFVNVYLKGFSRDDSNNAKHYLRGTDICGSYRIERREGELILTREYLGKKMEVKKPIGRTSPAKYQDWIDPEKAKVYDWLMAYKNRLMLLGNLCFDDAYFLAEEYLLNYPGIVKFLQQRFKYVFVDEMQDMDKNQHDLLERIFWDQGQSTTIYQRIGDKNQAIFKSEVGADDHWVDRQMVLELTGSHRLSKKIAGIVQSLALRPIAVKGLGDVIAGVDIEIQPHLFVYTDANKHLVIQEFAKTIKGLRDTGKLPASSKYPYKAVCWNTKEEGGKIRICDFHPSFKKDSKKPKVSLPVLQSYLGRGVPPGNSFRSVRKNILNGILRILLLEDIQDESGRIYTKTSLLKYLQEKQTKTLELLNASLYDWCQGIFKGEKQEVLKGIQGFMPTLLQLFGRSIKKSHDFIHNSLPAITNNVVPAETEDVNTVKHLGISVEIATVHTSKGQTHTGTLYLESFYQKNHGGGNYESERLAPQIKGLPMASGAHKFAIQSTKMAYVGFSRPTHLLGFAVHKDRFDSKLSDIDTNIWKVIHL